MGLEFALVHDATKEAYDLGKWCGATDWRTRAPASLDEVRTYFRDYYNVDGDPALRACVEPVSLDVWRFVEAHPGCRLVDEHDYLWRTELMSLTPEAIDAWGVAYVFLVVGDRYDVQQRALGPMDGTR